MKAGEIRRRPATIAHLIATNFYGGPEKQIVEHLLRLDASRYRGVVLSYLEGPENEILDRAETAGLLVRGVRMAGPLDLGAWPRLSQTLRQEAVDLLCCHGYKSAVMGWWTARRLGVPAIAFSRGYTGENRKVALYEALERRFLGRLAGIVCVSEGQRRRLESLGVQPRKAWIVHNAIDLQTSRRGIADVEQVRLRLGVPVRHLAVVAAGRLSPEKGHRFLIEAIAQLDAAAPAAMFLICGEGPCKENLKNQAARLGLSDRVSFVGFRRDFPEVLEAMDLMVLPSLTEGLPNVVLEAFAAAKPVVCTAVGGVPELVEDGRSGLLVQPGDPDSLARGIQALLLDPERRRRMGEAGRRRVERDFTFEEQTRKLESIYEHVLGARTNSWTF